MVGSSCGVRFQALRAHLKTRSRASRMGQVVEVGGRYMPAVRGDVGASADDTADPSTHTTDLFPPRPVPSRRRFHYPPQTRRRPPLSPTATHSQVISPS